MQKKIIIAVITALLASLLGLPKEITAPVVDKTYCLIRPSECSETEK